MTAAVPKYKISVDNYHKMAETGILKPEDRVELINGEIYQMSPINSLHAGSVNLINAFLSQFNQSFLVSIQNPIIINEYSEPEPDIALLKVRADFYTTSNPVASEVLWVIEVSDSTLRYDQTIKKELYAQAEIPEYWIINLVDHCIEVYNQLEDQVYQKSQIYRQGDQVSVPYLGQEASVDHFLIKI